MLDLLAEIESEPGTREIPDGWRGVVDFGELWTSADADLWPADGALPVGEPLTYGCEVRFLEGGPSSRIILALWAIDRPRPSMLPGAEFVLRDGGRPRATGRVLGQR
jgi:hypothetical protein